MTLMTSKFDSLGDDSIICLESTAHYGDNLIRYLVASSYKVRVINPITSPYMRKNNIRKTKTDKVDTCCRFPIGSFLSMSLT